MLVVDPIPLYKDGEWRRVPAIDSQAWINAGWSTSETEIKTEHDTENPPGNLPLSNQLISTESQAETVNLQPEPTPVYVEPTNTQATPSDTKVEQTKRKSSN